MTLDTLLEQFEKEFTHKEMWGDQEMIFLNEGSPEKMTDWLRTHIEMVEKSFGVNEQMINKKQETASELKILQK